MKTHTAQRGQAYSEFVVGFVVVGLFLFGAFHIWRYAEARQTFYSAARFATWERTVWQPYDDNEAEKHSIHRTEESLQKNTVMHQFSLPVAWRVERAGTVASGATPQISPYDAQAMLKPALRSFVTGNQSPDKLLTINTNSERQPGVWVGDDPTLHTLTSLKLERDVYRTVTVSLQNPAPSNFAQGLFGFLLPDLSMTKSMSLIANTWAGSPPMMRVRTARQLIVMSTGDPVSGTKANFLASFGQDTAGNNFSFGDLMGLTPWWNLVGGPNGLGGQYVLKKAGLDAGGANALLQSGGQYSWDQLNKSTAANLLLQAQLDEKEYYQPNAASSSYHWHLNIKDKTADASRTPPRNSVVNGRRKWMGLSLQNPIENYFPEGGK